MSFTRASIESVLNEALNPKKKLSESMGGGVESAIANMYTYIDNLKNAHYIDDKQEKVLEKSVEAMEKTWNKTLKGSGLSGF